MTRDPADRTAIDPAEIPDLLATSPAAACGRRFATLVADGAALESLIARSRESQEPLALRGLQFAPAARRLAVTAPGREIRDEDIPPDLGGEGTEPPTADDWCRELETWAARHLAGNGLPLLEVAGNKFERTLALVALARVQSRRQEAAKLIGWGRNTLTRKLRELGID